MPRLSTVTGFARHVGVTPKLLLIHHVGVTRFADLVAGEDRSAAGDLSDGVAAIVAVLAEAVGNDCAAKHDEKQ